jgi:hypothetical protein
MSLHLLRDGFLLPEGFQRQKSRPRGSRRSARQETRRVTPTPPMRVVVVSCHGQPPILLMRDVFGYRAGGAYLSDRKRVRKADIAGQARGFVETARSAAQQGTVRCRGEKSWPKDHST